MIDFLNILSHNYWNKKSFFEYYEMIKSIIKLSEWEVFAVI